MYTPAPKLGHCRKCAGKEIQTQLGQGIQVEMFLKVIRRPSKVTDSYAKLDFVRLLVFVCERRVVSTGVREREREAGNTTVLSNCDHWLASHLQRHLYTTAPGTIFYQSIPGSTPTRGLPFGSFSLANHLHPTCWPSFSTVPHLLHCFHFIHYPLNLL